MVKLGSLPALLGMTRATAIPSKLSLMIVILFMTIKTDRGCIYEEGRLVTFPTTDLFMFSKEWESGLLMVKPFDFLPVLLGVAILASLP